MFSKSCTKNFLHIIYRKLFVIMYKFTIFCKLKNAFSAFGQELWANLFAAKIIVSGF